jgi:exodeoxyribonuclease VII large subunit
MSKTGKSQWDFGELFPGEAVRQVWSVSELTAKVRALLERQLGRIWVSGEITNLRAQRSGHIYFTLKDAGAQLSCVLFRSEAVANRELLADGRKVILQGDVTVYEPRGQYQLIVSKIELHGVGALQIAFEKLKQKLQGEGLFAPERKRPIPKYPRRIGLVTSPTGAAIRDVLHVIQRRNPGLEIIFVPCAVQGAGAANEIAAAIALLNELNARRSERAAASALDLILLTRGGGSLEDLWAFNEEIVARAIAASAVPVVSAVGHEIDFTISDFVADLRAATPSAAAEIITEGVFSSCRFIRDTADWMRQRARQLFERAQKASALAALRLGRAHPRRRMNEKLQRLEELRTSLVRCVGHDLRAQRLLWQNWRERLTRVRPRQLLQQRRELLRQENRRLAQQARHRLGLCQNYFAQLATRLRLLSPEQVLARGYSITLEEKSGKVIRSSNAVAPGQKIKTKLKSGEIRSTVDREG